MMSREEQTAQHESIKKIERAAYAFNIKQIFSIIVVLIGTTTSVVTAFFHYDNGNKEQYANKKDFITLCGTVTTLSATVNKLSEQIHEYRYIDSLTTERLKAHPVRSKLFTEKVINGQISFVPLK